MKRVFADVSVIVNLIAQDSRTPGCKAAYLKLGCPRLMFTPLHELEVGNALRLRSFLAASRSETKIRKIRNKVQSY